MGGAHRIGIVGLGVISRQYLETFARTTAVEIVAVADLDHARAQSVAAGIDGCRALTVAELMAAPDLTAVLNLTIPAAHAEIALAAIDGGKDVFLEKPLAATPAEARSVLAAAATAGVRVGCAPDTVLGTGIQTARAAIEDGLIGAPVAAAATWMSAGHESWHPHPDFYYRAGGGPLLDMGPYYLTSLVQLLGPVVDVSGATSRSRDARTIGSGPRAGERIAVEVETFTTGILRHTSGALSTVTMSFDGVPSTAAPIEVHGVDGALVVPDPNTFAGDVVLHPREAEPQRLPASAGYLDGSRGIGLIDLLDGTNRAGGELALHVLEIMDLIQLSAVSGVRETVTSRPPLPPLMPLTAGSLVR